MSNRASKVALSLIAALTMSAAASATDMSDEAIKKRIEPVGQVYLSGEVIEQAPIAAAAKSGEEIYQASCFGCHGTGAAGAPVKGNADAWGPRVAQGMDLLLDHALKGFNAMPPKGTCMACSDEEIKAAVEFMIEGI